MGLQLRLTGCCLLCLLLKRGGWGRHGLMALFFLIRFVLIDFCYNVLIFF